MSPATDKSVVIAGLRLLFQHSRTGIEVTDAVTSAWVANVFRFDRPGGALVRHNYAYRDRLGLDDNDRHGAVERRAIAAHAALIYKDAR